MRYLFSRASVALYTLALVILSISPLPGPPEAIAFPHFDKVCHFFLYGIFSFITINTYLRQRVRHPYLACVGYVTIVGLLIECIQYFLPYRSFETMDIVVNGTGMLASLPFNVTT
ncbi:MAG: VanZ family protein [Candidatus Omnitrophota bacterium]|nr:VanZ family protein [Candidatus Omnitrophota bacterium]